MDRYSLIVVMIKAVIYIFHDTAASTQRTAPQSYGPLINPTYDLADVLPLKFCMFLENM